jgi:hypothetical protein
VRVVLGALLAAGFLLALGRRWFSPVFEGGHVVLPRRGMPSDRAAPFCGLKLGLDSRGLVTWLACREVWGMPGRILAGAVQKEPG